MFFKVCTIISESLCIFFKYASQKQLMTHLELIFDILYSEMNLNLNLFDVLKTCLLSNDFKDIIQNLEIYHSVKNDVIEKILKFSSSLKTILTLWTFSFFSSLIHRLLCGLFFNCIVHSILSQKKKGIFRLKFLFF